MSSCLILQGKDKLYIGADTSSSIFINERLYRLNNETKKLFKLDNNSILYCAGNNHIANIVEEYIVSTYNSKNFSFCNLQKWLFENFPLPQNTDRTVYDVEILIATIKCNKTIVYQMSQYNDFAMVTHEVPDRGIRILTAGIKNQDCILFAEKEMVQGKDIKSIYYNTFSNLSCNYIGGNLDLYELSKDGIAIIFHNQKIDESGIQYVYNFIENKSVSINAEVLMSKLVMSENLWIENDSGTYKFNDSGFVASSEKNSIMIQPNNDSELFSIYKGDQKQMYINSDGDVEFAGLLKSASGIFSGTISGGSINIGDGTFTVDSDGVMTAKSGTFSGTISGGTISGSAISGGSISGSTISGGVVSGGTISGSAISGGSISGSSVSGGVIVGAAISGGSLISTGDEGTTTIEGGHIIIDSDSTDAGMLVLTCNSYKATVSAKGISCYDGTYTSFITPELVTAQDVSAGTVLISNYLSFSTNARRTGTKDGTKDKTVYKVSNTMTTDDIASTGYVAGYVEANCVTSSALDGYVTETTLNNTLEEYAKTSSIPDAGIEIVNKGESSATSKTAFYYLCVDLDNDGIPKGSSKQYKKVKAFKLDLSDRRQKEYITDAQDISDAYMRLKPVHFKFKDGIFGVDSCWHYGFIAQDVKEAFDLAGIDTYGEALVGCDTNVDEWLLDKSEMHAMHVQMIQKHQHEIDQLKLELKELKEKVNGSTN